jgi:transglutaminase-like putative cysteine protease
MGIRPPLNTTVLKAKGGVWDIVEVIIRADKDSAPDTQELAQRLHRERPEATLHEAWQFVKTHVRYVRDKAGLETVKSPAKTWADGNGDCKAFSIFIASLLQNWGIPYVYRVAFYDPQQPQSGHIYPVAIIGGRKIPVDAVHTKFGEEVPYWKAYDVQPGSGEKTRLSGLTPTNGFLWGLAIVGFGLMFLEFKRA